MTWFDFLLWVPYTLYTAAYVPQIIKNHQEKSTEGLSPSMVIVRFSADLLYLLCAYLLALPIAYKVMMSLCCCAMMTLGFQEYLYSGDRDDRRRLVQAYAGVILSVSFIAWAGLFMPETVGGLAGWASILLFTSAELPQVYSNYDRQSLDGYTLWLPMILALGGLVEICLAVYLRLPKQSLYSALRVVFFYMIYLGQYIKYHLITEEA